ncbi:MAG: hypothetical protein LKG11_01310 [Bacilli bacterium]|jgi:hypothetical protein|nr:hypothetical protein [Bacilli bacterium]
MIINYRIEALDELLNEDCVLGRYFSLISKKKRLMACLSSMGCLTKNDCLKLSEGVLSRLGCLSPSEVRLFRRFLSLYDVDERKFKELAALGLNGERLSSYRELFLLPGVKSVRAGLYYESGLRSLGDIASRSYKRIIEMTQRTIDENRLSLKAPLIKEAKTHVAVSIAFTVYRAD